MITDLRSGSILDNGHDMAHELFSAAGGAFDRLAGFLGNAKEAGVAFGSNVVGAIGSLFNAQTAIPASPVATAADHAPPLSVNVEKVQGESLKALVGGQSQGMYVCEHVPDASGMELSPMCTPSNGLAMGGTLSLAA
jgi:hypothetical protein